MFCICINTLLTAVPEVAVPLGFGIVFWKAMEGRAESEMNKRYGGEGGLLLLLLLPLPQVRGEGVGGEEGL